MRVLGHNLWSEAKENLGAVVVLAAYRRKAVKACHTSGKTRAGGCGRPLVGHQSQGWNSGDHCAPPGHRSKKFCGAKFGTQSPALGSTIQNASATEIRLGPNRYAIGLSTNEGVRFQGFHGSVLIVLDEAPGVLPAIWEAIEGIRAGGDVRVLALGNPTISSGPFYDAFTSNREDWNLITIPAFGTPNLRGLTAESLLELTEEELDQNPRPYLVNRRWVKEKYNEWGPGHPLWESRVLGNFPQESDDALISLRWLELAKLRDDGDGELCGGLDIAGPGEGETVLCLRRGPKIVLLRTWAERDPRGAVLAELLPCKSQLKNLTWTAWGSAFSWRSISRIMA